MNHFRLRQGTERYLSVVTDDVIDAYAYQLVLGAFRRVEQKQKRRDALQMMNSVDLASSHSVLGDGGGGGASRAEASAECPPRRHVNTREEEPTDGLLERGSRKTSRHHARIMAPNSAAAEGEENEEEPVRTAERELSSRVSLSSSRSSSSVCSSSSSSFSSRFSVTSSSSSSNTADPAAFVFLSTKSKSAITDVADILTPLEILYGKTFLHAVEIARHQPEGICRYVEEETTLVLNSPMHLREAPHGIFRPHSAQRTAQEERELPLGWMVSDQHVGQDGAEGGEREMEEATSHYEHLQGTLSTAGETELHAPPQQQQQDLLLFAKTGRKSCIDSTSSSTVRKEENLNSGHSAPPPPRYFYRVGDYTLFTPYFCPCSAYAYQCVRRQEQACCKHMLALRIALQVEKHFMSFCKAGGPSFYNRGNPKNENHVSVTALGWAEKERESKKKSLQNESPHSRAIQGGADDLTAGVVVDVFHSPSAADSSCLHHAALLPHLALPRGRNYLSSFASAAAVTMASGGGGDPFIPCGVDNNNNNNNNEAGRMAFSSWDGSMIPSYGLEAALEDDINHFLIREKYIPPVAYNSWLHEALIA